MNLETVSAHSWGGQGESFVSATPSWLAPKMPAPAPAPAPMSVLDKRTSEKPAEEMLPAIEKSLAESALRPPPTPVIVEPEMYAEPAPPPYPDMREECEALKRELAEAARTMARLRREVLDASEADLVRLAGAIAERVVGRELSTDPTLIVAWAKEGIAALDAEDGVVVAVSPDLADAFPADEWNVAGEPLRMEVDPSLQMSKCEVRARNASVDVSAGARLSAVSRELGGSQ